MLQSAHIALLLYGMHAQHHAKWRTTALTAKLLLAGLTNDVDDGLVA